MEDTKKCPYCDEEILAVAKKCKHCGEWLDKAGNVPRKKTVLCPVCAEKIEEGLKTCPACKEPLAKEPKKELPKRKKKTGKIVWTIIFIWIAWATAKYFIYDKPERDRTDMEYNIKRSFQKEMDTDSSYKEYGMKVQEVNLTKSGSHSYKGFVTVLFNKKTYDISITVTTDGSSYMWETKQSDFSFLIEYELNNFNWLW